MYNLKTLTTVSEHAATDAIFNACRANEKREARHNVTFLLMTNGHYEAALRGDDGYVVALAAVDENDI
jgi:hypothetical protein